MPSMIRTDLARRAVLTLLALGLLALTLALPQPAFAQQGLEDLDNFPRVKLEIVDGKNRKKRHVFEVWVADTPPRQQQGLMFVRSLPEMHGMLFVHQNPKHISMWMQNTYIPLDMVFIDEKGAIQQIVERTTPFSRDTIRSKLPASAVLEIAGGEARRLGLKPGQHVSYPKVAGT